MGALFPAQAGPRKRKKQSRIARSLVAALNWPRVRAVVCLTTRKQRRGASILLNARRAGGVGLFKSTAMKKLLFALLVLFGVAAFTPKAEAGQYIKVWNGRCYTYVNKYSSGYDCAPRFTTGRPAPLEPVRHYRSYDYCDRPVRYYSSGPRFSINFGF